MYPTEPERNSILRRPLRTVGGLANEENAPKNYEREQARLAAKGEVQQQHYDRLKQAFYPTEEDKKKAAEVLEREVNNQLTTREAEQQRFKQQEAAWLAQQVPAYVDQTKPWATASYYAKEQTQAARKRIEIDTAEQNKKLAAEKHLQQRQARQQSLQPPPTATTGDWFNRGAPGQEEWLPQELRVHPRSTVPPHLALGPPPYYCDALEGPANNASTWRNVPRQQQRPVTSFAVMGGGGNVQNTAVVEKQPRAAAGGAATTKNINNGSRMWDLLSHKG